MVLFSTLGAQILVQDVQLYRSDRSDVRWEESHLLVLLAGLYQATIRLHHILQRRRYKLQLPVLGDLEQLHDLLDLVSACD